MPSNNISLSDIKNNDAAVAQAIHAITERENLLIVSPPCSTATRIAMRVPGSMALLTDNERVMREALYAHHHIPIPEGSKPSLRAPHHSTSSTALLGELALARWGVLFLDELLEFRLPAFRDLAYAWNNMRERPIVVAIVRPCPCGYHGFEHTRSCSCKEKWIDAHNGRLNRYLNLLSFGVTTTITAP